MTRVFDYIEEDASISQVRKISVKELEFRFLGQNSIKNCYLKVGKDCEKKIIVGPLDKYHWPNIKN